MKSGFTLLEVLTVVIIIGILSALGYSSMFDLIQTNKAKDTARAMTSFTERVLAEAKMKKKPVTITLNGQEIIAQIEGETPMTYSLSNGFSKSTESCADCQAWTDAADKSGSGLTAVVRMGVSGVDEPSYMTACAGVYCGSTLKSKDQNKFQAWIKRRNGNWEAL